MKGLSARRSAIEPAGAGEHRDGAPRALASSRPSAPGAHDGNRRLRAFLFRRLLLLPGLFLSCLGPLLFLSANTAVFVSAHIDLLLVVISVTDTRPKSVGQRMKT